MRQLAGETHPEMRESREPVKGYTAPEMSLGGDIQLSSRSALRQQFLSGRCGASTSLAALLAPFVWEARHDR